MGTVARLRDVLNGNDSLSSGYFCVCLPAALVEQLVFFGHCREGHHATTARQQTARSNDLIGKHPKHHYKGGRHIVYCFIIWKTLDIFFVLLLVALRKGNSYNGAGSSLVQRGDQRKSVFRLFCIGSFCLGSYRGLRRSYGGARPQRSVEICFHLCLR